MVSGDEVHGSGYGKHRFILETGVQHFRRKPEDHFGKSGTGESVKGQKTDPNDSRWLASLLRHGLVQGSFIPPRDIRELRDLTRRRRRLVGDGAAEKNRVQKILEDANVKIGNVLSDVFGSSGQAMLEALVEKKLNAAEIAELAHGRLRQKMPQIAEALEGHRMTDHHRFLTGQC